MGELQPARGEFLPDNGLALPDIGDDLPPGELLPDMDSDLKRPIEG